MNFYQPDFTFVAANVYTISRSHFSSLEQDIQCENLLDITKFLRNINPYSFVVNRGSIYYFNVLLCYTKKKVVIAHNKKAACIGASNICPAGQTYLEKTRKGRQTIYESGVWKTKIIVRVTAGDLGGPLWSAAKFCRLKGGSPITTSRCVSFRITTKSQPSCHFRR